MDASMNIQPATPEIVWAMLKELTKKNAELAERQAELAESQAETDRQMKETDRKLEKIGLQFGGMAYNQGLFAEDYFFNSFERGKRNFFGEKFDDIKKNLKGLKTDDEFDIVMLNGKTVGIVEVKYKAHENDVPSVLKKAITFRANFADYKSHRVYLGLATRAFYPELEKACKDNGIAIIKQAGDTVVIYDKHLKAF